VERYICIHGHFYQPPRENPWLEAIEVQDSAYPYHDWNERIATECYAPNAVARMLDDAGHIVRLINNYSRISFNFGPTLLSWMQDKAPEVYQAILEADRESQRHFSGHGSALAQCYNHVIMPLANLRDKYTQVLWGIRDFEHRFQRKPEGMWLAETAVNLETLEVLAERGIRFTILSPYQAVRLRPLPAPPEHGGTPPPGHGSPSGSNPGAPPGSSAPPAEEEHPWQDVRGGRIDPTMAYLQHLPSGRSINLFFYDGPISQAVAFEGLLVRGEYLAGRLLGAFSEARTWPQLVHIATDGETYGHHHRYGDMALVYALEHIEANGRSPGSPRLTNYAEFLARHPPTHEVEILENTAWSCSHGIGRWREDCGCSGGRGDWNQRWRKPLRESLDWLRDHVAPLYEEKLGQLFRDPWAARNDYIGVILDRSAESIDRFLSQHSLHDLGHDEQVQALQLLEMQRHAQLMYTSCGWFFDELTRIETVQVMQYAGRVLQLAEELFAATTAPAETPPDRAQDVAPDEPRIPASTNLSGAPLPGELEEGFLQRLERAQSNLPDHGHGRKVFEKFVKSYVVDWTKVGAHYAVSSLFASYPEEARLFCYDAVSHDHQLLRAGNAKLAVGQAQLTSAITRDTTHMSYAALHFGDHNVSGGVRAFQQQADYQVMVNDLAEAFSRADFPEVIRLLDRHFEQTTYSLRSLFRDEQRAVLQRVLQGPKADAEAVYRRLYEQNQPTMRFLASLGAPLPSAFRQAAQFLINNDLQWAFEEDEPDLGHIQHLMQEAVTWNVDLDVAGLSYRLNNTLDRMAARPLAQPEDLGALTTLRSVVELGHILPCEMNLWQVQNAWFALSRAAFPQHLAQLVQGEASADSWLQEFLSLGETLGIQVSAFKKKVDEADLLPRPGDAVEAVRSCRRVPGVLYRLQLSQDFPFGQVQALLPYLHELGVTDLCLPPILLARPGSVQGYDVCDHGQIDPVFGGKAGFCALADAVREQGMGLLVESALGHMSITHSANTWWLDVLENGPSSEYAPYFDIDWHPTNPSLEDKVLLPILEDQYGRVLEQGRLKLTYESGGFVLEYQEHRLPVAPRTYDSILEYALGRLVHYAPGDAGLLPPDHVAVQELQSILTAIRYLPPRTEQAPERIRERRREKEIIKRRVAGLYASSAEFRTALLAAVQTFNGTPGDANSFVLLDALVDEQAYRLAYWRVATEEINYRRFFDINDLAAIRLEVPEVFRATHRLLLQLLSEGRITGLRVDHPDGLWDPAAYFRQLQEAYLGERLRAYLGPKYPPEELALVLAEARKTLGWDRESPPEAWPLYLLVNKILSEGEQLPSDWAVAGTCGYDFLNAVNELFLAQGNAGVFDQLYAWFLLQEGTRGERDLDKQEDVRDPVEMLGELASPEPLHYPRLVYACKKMVMLGSLASEIDDLAHRLDRLAETNRRYRDFTLISLTRTVREVIACLPIHRSHITSPERVSDRDREFIERAVSLAKRENPRTAEPVFDFVRDTLLLRNSQDFREGERGRLLEWVQKFQQLTGPVMARGVEETAFWIYNRLISLNEVGGNPARFGLGIEAFHAHNQERRACWPHSLCTTGNQESKRSDDVRARLQVLSEMPERWREKLDHWSKDNAPHKSTIDGQAAPNRNDEYLLYQTLVGTWPPEPFSAEVRRAYHVRMIEHMATAAREAKIQTNWINPSEAYHQAVRHFVDHLLLAPSGEGFRKDLADFVADITFHGWLNSLGHVLLKLTAPGVPEIYQGSELWDYSLSAPDNRRSVDYLHRRKLLAELKHRVASRGGANRGPDLLRLAQTLLMHLGDGRVKLFLLWRTLQFRREHPQLFLSGSYTPLEVAGEKSEHVCAFARASGEEEILVLVPRLVATLVGQQRRAPLGPGVWWETRVLLPRGGPWHYRNLYTGETMPVREDQGQPFVLLAAVFAHWPVALLERVQR
jgi:(1->4)-alpha-D-glucan 1-alpha-D-glucosylmutase